MPAPPQAPDFQIKKEHRAKAESLTSFYQHVVSQHPTHNLFRGEKFIPELRSMAGEIPLRDVSTQVEQFSQDLVFAEKRDLPIPMVDIPEVGKIPILGISEMSWRDSPPLGPAVKRNIMFAYADTVWPRKEVLFEASDVAQEGFFSAVRQFLEYRIAGYAFWKRNYRGTEENAHDACADDTCTEDSITDATIGGREPPFGPPPSGPPSNPPFSNGGGLVVTLTCQNHNLRALASTAIGLQWHQFGSPTSPVTGILPPGLWLFAADGGKFGSKVVPDKIPARIPPLLTPCATAF